MNRDTLNTIASLFNHMPDEDITVLERQVAETLVEAGYLKKEDLEVEVGGKVINYGPEYVFVRQ